MLRPLTLAVRTSLLSPASVRGLTSAALLSSLLRALWSTLLAVSPLLVMGLARLAVHEAVNYQRHESEYGLHWNFFFTSVAVALLAAALEAAWRTGVHAFETAAHRRLHISRSGTAAGYALLGVAVATCYQVLLRAPAAAVLPSSVLGGDGDGAAGPWTAGPGPASAAGAAAAALTGHVNPFSLEAWILHAPREGASASPSAASAASAAAAALLPGDASGGSTAAASPLSAGLGYLLAANREGLAGCLGFFAIYLAGVGMGRVLLDPTRTSPDAWRALLLRGAVACAGLWAALGVSIAAVGPVSRRLVNLPYVLWVVAFAATMIAAMLAIDVLTVTYNGRPAQTQQQAEQTAGPHAAAAGTAGASTRGDSEGQSAAPAAAPTTLARMVADRGSGSAAPVLARSRRASSASGALERALEAAAIAGGAAAPLHIRLLLAAQHMFIEDSNLPASVLRGGSVIMTALNRNFLAIFIVANLLVGVPNHTLPTIDISDGVAMTILTAYVAAVCAIAVSWRAIGLQLKFW